ncbi:MAG: Ig-like domain-containing protein [Deltaproteobacteria bacterium]|nr:Ig-like domain-containing protein [Deltaproteobacteria bacterium]
MAGSTFYLPRVDGGDKCDGLSWRLSTQPSGSEASVVDGADGYARLTPVVPGRYAMTLEGGNDSRSVELGVVSADERPFYNLNYYPSHSAERVGEELWVANVQVSSITRMDPGSLDVLGEIPVGPWPVSLAWHEGMDFAVVAQRGSDTLGLVDVASGRLIDAIWVGDEPSNVVLSPDGETAYVALKSESAVAVVDLASRTRRARIDVVADPLAMAISPDGSRLWVASHRSGQPSRHPYASDSVEAERDIAVVDTETDEVVDWWLDVGTTLTALMYREETDELMLSRLLNDTMAPLGDETQPSFTYEVAALDPSSGDVLRSTDVGRQATAAGLAVSLHGMTLAEGRLWVVAESSDLAVALDPDSLAELGRVDVPGRPRSIVALGNEVFAHGAQGPSLTKIVGLETVASAAPTTDSRSATVAAGQAYFTGAGQQYAVNWSCNACHVDGLSDTLVWNAGPFSAEKVSRPFYWLEGTYPLGWDGYLSSVDNYAFTVNTNVGVRPTTEEHAALSAYLSSLMPPPAANGATERDGSLTELALAGKALYEGKAACSSCHPLPLTTTRQVLATGVTEGTTDIPGLVGAYRLGVWHKRGEGTTLSGAVDEVFASLGDPQLDESEREALDRFLLEMTARNFFVLSTEPRAGDTAIAIDQPINVTFSHPVFDDSSNLARVGLRGPDGAEVPVDRDVSEDGRHLLLTPQAPLEHGTEYVVAIDPQFESFDQGTLWAPDTSAPAAWESPLTTASAPALRLEGSYRWTVDMPTADLEEQAFDLDQTLEVSVDMVVTETAGGGEAVIDYGQDLVLERAFVIDGDTVRSPALPIPIGPSFADSTGMQATFVDEDGDGVGDFAEGELTISGPGFLESGITWRLTRQTGGGECVEGSAGELPVTVVASPDGPVVDWGSTEPDAVGVYFIGPDALPPAGPGQPVTGGEVFWAAQLEEFPNGFAGPVTYGVVPPGAVDETAGVGGGDGPVALEPGMCVKVNVLTTNFQQGEATFIVQ